MFPLSNPTRSTSQAQFHSRPNPLRAEAHAALFAIVVSVADQVIEHTAPFTSDVSGASVLNFASRFPPATHSSNLKHQIGPSSPLPARAAERHTRFTQSPFTKYEPPMYARSSTLSASPGSGKRCIVIFRDMCIPI